jgi:hypothetical protein
VSMNYPAEEHTWHVDYFGTNLPDILIHTNSALASLREEAQSQREARERWDEGVCCLEYMLSRKLGFVSSFDVIQLLGDVTVYGNVNRRSDWINAVLAEMGKGE